LAEENLAITNIDRFNNWAKKEGNHVLKRLLWIFWILFLTPFTMLESSTDR